MHLINTHQHWWPHEVFDFLIGNGIDMGRNDKGGYSFRLYGHDDGPLYVNSAVWHDLDGQFEYMDKLGHRVDSILSIGPMSVYFSSLPADLGRDAALVWNEQMAEAQRKHPGRLWASAAVPLIDTRIAIDVLEDAVHRLGLMGVNIPSSIGMDPNIDAERLEPFYAKVAELDLPLFLHPTDAIFPSTMEGYNGALFRSLGRVVEVSVAASRIMFSGLMDRYPNLKVFVSHTGGALPYQSGRMDKNGVDAKLPNPCSHYIHRMYTDTCSPHALGIKFAIDYFGIDQVMYGDDYPCWNTATNLALIEELGLSEAEQKKLFLENARRFFKLEEAGRPTVKVAAAAHAAA